MARKFDTKFDGLEKRMTLIEHAIIEIQTFLKTKFRIDLSYPIAIKYGQSHNPIVIKEEFKKFIKTPKLDQQIKEKEAQLLEWLKAKKPQTGLDAQDYISEFVISDEVSKYLNLKEYKQHLYQQGKTTEDAVGILAVYLFGILIPKLQFEEKKQP